MIKSRVTEWMSQKGVNIYRLAKEARVSKETVTRSRGEKIEACTLKTLEKIAKTLEVKVKDLFEEK